MHFPFITNNRQPEEHHLVVIHEPQSMSVEGSEFLDDALRMEDLIPRTEECVASGAPENLL